MSTLDIAEERELLSFLPERKPDANKGSCGRAVIIAGAPGMAGAACLAARAAYRSGAGLVELITFQESAAALQQLVPEAIVSILPDSVLEGTSDEWLEQKLKRASSVAVGPGLSQSREAALLLDRVLACVSEHDCAPLVIDADGLNLLAKKTGYPRIRRLVMTPHPGELSRLLGCSTEELKKDFRQAGRKLCEKYGCVAVCKDARTLISLPDGGEFLNITGNDGMAVGGSGDVLTGVIAGLLAQGASEKEAAVLGTWLHGRAGDLAAKELGKRSMLSSDIAAFLGQAIEELSGKDTSI